MAAMLRSRAVVIVGLTGGIGSGKSTVSAGLAARGAVVIDADAITRELQQPGQVVFDEIVEHFGPSVVTADGALDRQALADIVFNDPEARKVLEGMVHPAVGAEIATRMAAEVGTDHVVVLDVPLLVESGRDDMAGTIVVDVDPEVAVQRLITHRGMAEADVRARMASQIARDERLAHADFVIDNSGSPADLEREIDRCWAWIEGMGEQAS
jgi:dephospho-CoA kinase